MFRKSRWKIVTALMSVLVFLFAGTLCVIYFSSYIQMLQKNREMLSRYADSYWINGNPSESMETPAGKQTEVRRLTFYSVAFSPDGQVLDVDSGSSALLDNSYLSSQAATILALHKTSGIHMDWVYYIETEGDATLVVLMDNSVMNANIRTLFQYTLIFGALTLVLLFLVSLFLSRRIVQPLEESYRKQKQFVSDADHELKSPLTVINTNLDLLEQEKGPSRWLGNIRHESRRMSGLVGQLLELARTEEAAPPMERLNFSRLVTGNLLPFEALAYEKNLTLESEIQENVFVNGNPEQLENLISTLTDNALSYAPEHTAVRVRLCAYPEELLFSVSNEGKPLSEEQMDSIFDRFYRADEVRSGDSGHYGLGLAIARAAVLSHHGKIQVSCQEGRVIFTVRLRPASPLP
ncbi:MAG: HAMP domain-containing histidine kinase [Clostridiales bacterium]|nr:HAMP domain-containing histidine kinase [Clostridiales bacterium]